MCFVRIAWFCAQRLIGPAQRKESLCRTFVFPNRAEPQAEPLPDVHSIFYGASAHEAPPHDSGDRQQDTLPHSSRASISTGGNNDRRSSVGPQGYSNRAGGYRWRPVERILASGISSVLKSRVEYGDGRRQCLGCVECCRMKCKLLSCFRLTPSVSEQSEELQKLPKRSIGLDLGPYALNMGPGPIWEGSLCWSLEEILVYGIADVLRLRAYLPPSG